MSQLYKAVEPQSTRGATQNGHAIIECQEVIKAFGDHTVLDGVSCSMPEGEISVVMGPSGTSKSVLLRHIVGLLLPDQGDVLVGGRCVPDLNEGQLLELRRNMRMLLHGGKVVDQGSKEEIKNSPKEFTQQFIKGAVAGPLGMD